MKIADTHILFVPGYRGADDNHWQSRWASKMPRTSTVIQRELTKPVREDWVNQVLDDMEAADGPLVIVAHSLGVACAIHAMQDARGAAMAEKIKGAFLVAPPDVANSNIRPKHLMTFGPYPREPLPFPSFVIASRNDEYADFAVSEDIANAWGSFLVDAGESGHINSDSGHGPWPEGLMVFAEFMKRI